MSTKRRPKIEDRRLKTKDRRRKTEDRLPIGVCAARRGHDFRAPDLERAIQFYDGALVCGREFPILSPTDINHMRNLLLSQLWC